MAKRDTQRAAVYLFGWALPNPYIDLEAANRLVAKYLPDNPPTIRICNRRRNKTTASHHANEIVFAPKMFGLRVLLHEIAHFITYQQHGDRVAAHGPEYMGNFINLLSANTPFYTTQSLLDLAYVCGVKVRPEFRPAIHPAEDRRKLARIKVRIDDYRGVFKRSQGHPDVIAACNWTVRGMFDKALELPPAHQALAEYEALTRASRNPIGIGA